jgi:hypothetical protein
MSALEEKTIQTVHRMWDCWENLSQASIQESALFWAEDCKGFGTSQTEIWHNRNDFLKCCDQSFLKSPEGFSVAIKWLETNHLSDQLVGLWGEIIIIIKQPIKNLILDPVRVTGVFKEIGEEMKIVQWHASEPDVSDKE